MDMITWTRSSTRRGGFTIPWCAQPLRIMPGCMCMFMCTSTVQLLVHPPHLLQVLLKSHMFFARPVADVIFTTVRDPVTAFYSFVGLLLLTPRSSDSISAADLDTAERYMRDDLEQQRRLHVCPCCVDQYESGIGSAPGVAFDAVMEQARRHSETLSLHLDVKDLESAVRRVLNLTTLAEPVHSLHEAMKGLSTAALAEGHINASIVATRVARAGYYNASWIIHRYSTKK